MHYANEGADMVGSVLWADKVIGIDSLLRPVLFCLYQVWMTIKCVFTTH